MASNAATYRQPTSSHYIIQTPPSCAPTSLAVARAQHLHHGSRSKRTSRSLDTTSTPGKSTLGGPLGGLLASPSKPVAARRGQWRLSRGLHWHAALPQDAACLRTGVVWRRTTSHCSSSDAGPPAPKMDAPARVQGSMRLGARDGVGGECAQHRPRRRASALCSWHQASRTADFPRSIGRQNRMMVPGEPRGSLGGRQPLGPSTGGIQWPALYGAGPSAWPTADHRQKSSSKGGSFDADFCFQCPPTKILRHSAFRQPDVSAILFGRRRFRA